MKSFYSRDYIIDATEKRFAEYVAAYQVLVKSISTLMIVYSAITIVAVPLAREILQAKHVPVIALMMFLIFTLSFIVSVSFAVFMVFPETDTLLPNPAGYYYYKKERLRKRVVGIEVPLMEEIDNILFEKYIAELSYLTMEIERIVRRKNKFYVH